MIVYYNQCETCHNSAVKQAKQVMLTLRKEFPNIEWDERYIRALPQWQNEAKKIGGELPFLFSPTLHQHLSIKSDDFDAETVRAFLQMEANGGSSI